MKILETERLVLSELTLDDAEFIFELVNEPAYLRNIGDKGVRNLDGARAYLRNGPLASYRDHGYGVYRTALEDGTPIGICGLLKRDHLDAPDVGFAFLAAYRQQGYGYESASAVMTYGREVLGMDRILAAVSPHNAGSIRLLEKLGMRFERTIQMGDEGDVCQLFTTPPSS
ncbi:MAG: GNAT family N-acetyltransferase [Acidobacteriota bacterium]